MSLRKWLILSVIAFFPLSNHASTNDIKKPLPKVIVLSTGGTIAGESVSATDTTDYKAGQRSGKELITAVPEIANVADIEVEQVANVSSPNLQYSHLLALSHAANRHLKNPEVAAVVITHGTSTAEETAIFLDLTVPSGKPVVVVGAMRPATAISADGPFNLLQAVALAAHPAAAERGTMIVSNDRITSAMYGTKTHTVALDTFQAADQGHLGVMVGTTPCFFYTPAIATGKPYFDVSDVTTLPKVDILYGYVENDASMLDYLVAQHAQGIVVAGPGNSSLSEAFVDKIKKLEANGFPVVRASRTGAGIVTPKKEGIAAGFYNPQKARLLLALSLNAGNTLDEIKANFFQDVNARR